MLPKKSFLIYLILFTFFNCFFGLKLDAQYLKGVNKDWVLDLGSRGDTCEILFNFGNAKFTKYYSVNISLTDSSNISNIGAYENRIINDSTLSLKFPTTNLNPQINYLFGYINVLDEKMKGRNIGNYKIQILRKNNNVDAYIKNSFPNIITDTLIEYVKLEILGEKTHFLEPNTSFHYKIENQFGSNVFDSVEVISNELAYVYLPIKSTHLLGAYQLYYTNKRDLTVNPKWVSLETKAYGTGKMNINLIPRVSKYYTQGIAPASICIELPKTEAFNPDTFLLNIKGQIQLANTRGVALPIYFETDSIILDTGYLPWDKTKVKLYFNFSLPYYLPSGNYDLILTHPQLVEARLIQPINIHRPNLNYKKAVFPGWPFELDLKLKPNPMELAELQFDFEPNSGLYFDSVKFSLLGKDTVGIKIYAYSDSTTKDGNYDLQILQPNKYPIFITDAIRVMSELPQNLRFIPNYLINIGRADSSKRILSFNLFNLITNKYLAPIRFSRNGIIDSKITIKQHSDYKSYKQIIFIVDSNAIPGFYNAEIYDTLSQKWYLQKDAVYVMNAVSRAVEISPKTVAYTGGGETRLYTCWFKNTHFSQANEIHLGSNYHSVVVVNDTCIQFRGGNDQPAFYNNIDGYIGNDFLMNLVYEPSITLNNPNWIAKKSRSKITLHSDATNWTYFREIQFNFRKDFVYEKSLKTISYHVINDTILEFEVEAGDSLAGTYDLRIDQYPPSSFSAETIVLKDALKIVPVGIIENTKEISQFPILLPNPNNGNFEILTNGNSFQTFEITDIQGKQILTSSFDQATINVSTVLKQAGLYYIKLNGAKTIVLKFVVTQ